MSRVSTEGVKASSSRASALYESLPLKTLDSPESYSCKSEIRVFDLDLDEDDAPIGGFLRTVDLNSKSDLTFTALSYCWTQASSERCTHLPGEAKDPTSTSKGVITCNSQYPIEVPWNCLDALWHLRKAHRSPRTSHLTIWVDSICMNQKDDEEKSHQIGLMAEIYASAKVTYFWLGPGSEATDSAMNYLLNVGTQECKLPETLVQALAMIFFCEDIGLLLRILGSSLFSSLRQPYFEELDEMFQLPWIQRLWTFQEAMLPGHAEIYCGDKRIPWPTMVCALEFLNTHALHPSGLIFPISYGDWHRLSVSWRQKDKRLYRHPPGREPGTGRASITQRHVLRRRIFVTGMTTRTLVAACSSGLLRSAGVGFYSVDVRSVPGIIQAILFCVSLLFTCFIFSLYAKSKPRKLASINIQLPAAQSLLGELLIRKSNFDKDKYFALFGIIGDENAIALPQQSSIEVIYRQLSLDILRYTDSLDMLLYAPGISTSRFSNSWIVDWRDCSNVWDVCRWRLSRLSRIETETSLMSSKEPSDMLEQYRGPEANSTKSPWSPCCVPLGHALSVKGLIVGRLEGLQKPVPFEPIEANSEDSVLIQSVSSFQKVAQRMSAELRESFFQHLGALLLSRRGCATDMTPGSQWAKLFLQNFKDAFKHMSEDLSEDTLRSLLRQTPRWWNTIRGRADARAAWEHHVRLVKFFSDGNMVVFDFQDSSPWGSGQIYGGIAPQDVQDQDVVVLLHRCPMPMILRPDGRGSFAVVGPCFVPGMMDGEPLSLSMKKNSCYWDWTDLELV